VELSLAGLNALVRDGVTDIFISARAGVWVRTTTSTQRIAVEYDEESVSDLAVQLIDRGGRHIDEAQPWADVALASGVRVHAVLGGVSASGTEISIRVPRANPVTLEEFFADCATGDQFALVLRDRIQQRMTCVITGATGSGKTTLLAALMSCVPESERILTIEDVAELRIHHPRVVRLQTRQANYESRGAVTMGQLVREALRMRPDRLVLGECRGVEVLDALLAFTTGHPGGGTTLHARSLDDALVRLGGLLSLAGLSDAAAARMIVSAVDFFVHIDATGGERTVTMAVPRLLRESGQQARVELVPIDAHAR
jgi:pilus assembly protein CpaF